MKTELDSAWESAIHNAERARKAEAEIERLRAVCGALRENSSDLRALIRKLGQYVPKDDPNRDVMRAALSAKEKE